MNTLHVRCVDCKHLRGPWCVNARNAGLHADRRGFAEIGRTLQELPQRCPGFVGKQ